MPKSFLLKRRSLPSSVSTNIKITEIKEREADQKSRPLKIVQEEAEYNKPLLHQEEAEYKPLLDQEEAEYKPLLDQEEAEYKPLLQKPTKQPLFTPPRQEVNFDASRALAMNDQFMALTASRPFSVFSPFYQIGMRPDGLTKSFHRADYSNMHTARPEEHFTWGPELGVHQEEPFNVFKREISFVSPPKFLIPGEAKQPYQCEQCGKIFKTKYTLAIHLKMPNHTFARPFVCNTCGKGFRLSSTLCRHKIIHTKEKPYKCHVCEKAFNRSSTLKTHVRTHSEQKEFICDRCGKGFHQKGNLRNHILIHTGEKPYKCTLCQKAFNKLSNLKFHMHVHTDNSPYRCKFCKVSFTRRCDLKSHIQSAHVENKEK